MENNFGGRFQPHHPDMQSIYMNSLSSPLDPRQLNASLSSVKSGSDAFAMDEMLPGSSGAPHFRCNRANQPHGWFYCFPHFHQSFYPVRNLTQKMEIPGTPFLGHKEALKPDSKRFIVFDQSGGQTTVGLSSGIRMHVPSTSQVPNIVTAYGARKIELEAGSDTVQRNGPILTIAASEDNQNVDLGTEMHEDTEEINALLCSSDEEDEYSENEEASTGHSPCTFTANDKQQLSEEFGDEVASSSGPAKRMKFMDGGNDLPSLHDTARSDKPWKSFHYEDDAESICADEKRSRKEKIREKVRILQNILPGGNSKDAIVILDETIGYLKSLKHKALDLGVEII